MRDAIMSGEAVRERRLALRMTQKDFAIACGFALSFIKYVEAGRSQPSDVNALVMCDVLHCTIEDISTPKTATSSGSAA